MNLLENVYLPDFKKRQIRDSEAYKLLEKNGMDTSPLEGNYEEKAINVKMKDFDSYINEGGTKEDWVALHADKETQKEFFGTIGDFLVDTGKDTVLSLGVAAINGADVATNLMPVVAKLLDNSPLATAMPNGFMNAETEEQIYNAAKTASDNLGKARDYLKSFKEDDNIVSQLIGVMGQDLVYSVPMYKALRNAGVPQYPAFFISGGVGGAIGIEEKVLGEDSTFSKSLFAKDIKALKDLVGILPNTPEDKIADEVVQALEYGAFSTAIPAVIDSFKFMKRYIPAFAGGAAITTMSGDDAEASPIKAIANAVFKSSVRDAAEKKITSGSGQQILNTIQNTPGVKSSEIKWIGLDTFLKDKKKVTQEEVLKFIEDNRIDVTEVMFPRTGKDFGMYNDMLESIEQRKINFVNSKKDLRGGDQRIDFDNYNVSTQVEPNENKVFSKELVGERLSYNDIVNFNPVGKTIRSFDDPNTFEIDVDAIKNKYRSDELENTVDFYIVDDITDSGRSIAISKAEFEDPKFNSIVKTVTKGEPVGPKYELEFITNISFDELDKFALEYTSRNLKKLRSKQEGTTRYETYTEPGGEDYKELIFKFKQKGLIGGDKPIPVETRVTRAGNIDEYAIEESPHFKEPGEIAHVRFKTREIDRGMKKVPLKVLSVEEMQSDLVQSVKRSNQDMKQDALSFDGEVENIDAMDSVITDFPFKNNWYELTLKRLIRYAADNGFDAISIPKASVVQDRYNLTRRIEDLNITMFDPKRNEFGLMGRDQNGVTQIDDIYTAQDIEKQFGKDVFNKIKNKAKELSDTSEDYPKVELTKIIEMGGEGKGALYNKTIPAFLKKYGKKWNAKVYDDNIVESFDNPNLYTKDGKSMADDIEIPVTILEVTPEMKQSVQETPQALFSYFGGTVLGAELVSDTIQNNIISDQTN